MRRSLILIATASAAVGLGACGSSTSSSGGSATAQPQQSKPAATASSAPMNARLMIQHMRKGCHGWFAAGSTKGVASTTMQVAPGGTLTIANNDVMPHTLIQKGGTPATLTTPVMNRPGATGTIKFPSAGTYRFITKAGEDYPTAKGVETVGPDNRLKLTVVVE